MRWGVVGVGELARSHIGPALMATPDARLVAAASRRRDDAEAFVREHGGRACSGTEELVERADVDAVYVATPNHLHYEVTLAAVRAGKHVLCEKPLAPTVTEAREMTDAARAAGVVLRVGLHLRFEPVLQAVAAHVAGGAVGRPLELSMQRCAPVRQAGAWRREAGGGILADVGIHLVDLAGWVTGLEIETASAVVAPRPDGHAPAETAAMTLRLRGDTLASLRCTREASVGLNDLVVTGTDGVLATGPLRWQSEHQLRVSTPAGVRKEQHPVVDLYRRELEAFGHEVAGRTTPLATAEEGVALVEMMAELERTARGDEAPRSVRS